MSSSQARRFDRTVFQRVYLVAGLLVVARAVYAVFMNLVPDEAYYWDWSRYLSAGYYDHPPMIAWLTWLTTRLFGNTTAGIKAVPILATAVSTWAMLSLARRLCRLASSLYMVLAVLNLTLVLSIVLLLLTPDAPQLLFWALGLRVAYTALFENRSWAWPLLGIIAGLGLLSKYVFVLFFISMAVVLVADRAHRRLLLSWKPYAAAAVAALTFLPNVIWNARHEWVSYAFQLSHGLAAKRWPRFDLLGEYIGGQLGVVTPLLFVLMVVAAIAVLRSHRNDSRLLFLVAFFAVPLLFFAWSSLSKRTEANWACPAYVSGTLLVAWWWDNLDRGTQRARRMYALVSVALAGLVTVMVLAHVLVPFIPLPVRRDTTAQLRGWRRFARDVEHVRSHVDPSKRLRVAANRYQLTSLLAFHLPDQPRTVSMNIHSRANHYECLPSYRQAWGDSVIFVEPLQDSGLPAHVAKGFEHIEACDTVDLHISRTVTRPHGVYVGKLNPKSDVP